MQNEQTTLAIAQIRLDGGTQPRAEMNQAVIDDYAELMQAGITFPSVTVFNDGNEYWLADGFHRIAAAKCAVHTEINATVHQGTRRDAVLFSVGANADHGLRRTNADKRRVVELLLADEEWSKWSDREIARRCKVSNHFVKKTRNVTGNIPSETTRTYINKHGSISEMDTSNIGSTELSDSEILRKAKEIKRERRVQRLQEREESQAAELETNHPLHGESFKLIRGDLEKATHELEDQSVDAIITDPPYGKDALPLYESLSAVAQRVLKPHGHCIVMVGQAHLPDIIDLLGTHLHYRWTLAYVTPGQSVQVWGRNVKSNWKPVLVFTPDKHNWEHVDDVIRSDAKDKRFHEWGQSVAGMAQLIERFTVKNELILDPFCGGGTTGVAALELGRLFVGIDLDEECVRRLAGRLSDVA